jgi:hypothetical protein
MAAARGCDGAGACGIGWTGARAEGCSVNEGGAAARWLARARACCCSCCEVAGRWIACACRWMDSGARPRPSDRCGAVAVQAGAAGRPGAPGPGRPGASCMILVRSSCEDTDGAGTGGRGRPSRAAGNIASGRFAGACAATGDRGRGAGAGAGAFVLSAPAGLIADAGPGACGLPRLALFDRISVAGAASGPVGADAARGRGTGTPAAGLGAGARAAGAVGAPGARRGGASRGAGARMFIVGSSSLALGSCGRGARLRSSPPPLPFTRFRLQERAPHGRPNAHPAAGIGPRVLGSSRVSVPFVVLALPAAFALALRRRPPARGRDPRGRCVGL